MNDPLLDPNSIFEEEKESGKPRKLHPKVVSPITP